MKKARVIPLKEGEKKEIDYNRRHDLTVEEVKACPAFRDMTDQQALEVIDTIKQICRISLEYIDNQQNKLNNSENGLNIAYKGKAKIIELNPPKNKAA